MKRVMFSLMLLVLIGTAKANQNLKKSVRLDRAVSSLPLKHSKIQKNIFLLTLIAVTDACPSGFAGPGRTFWVVVDVNTGGVVGGGVYDQCYPVYFA